jgi:uracil-DNA glycosylase
MTPPQMEESWKEALKEEWSQPYLQKLVAFLALERKNYPIYPSPQEVFQAFNVTPFEKTQVVIIGQDPYHGPGQAHGLSFSVKPGIPFPPSLKNIFKELSEDIDLPPPSHGCLLHWAKQGVLLLNNVLTVRQGEPRSHARQGWEQFTDNVVKVLAARKDPLIFLLWGKDAQEKCNYSLSGASHHFILKSPHPSPFSAHSGFFGSRPFSKINDLLKRQGKNPIDWRI